MNKRYIVRLNSEQRRMLRKLVSSGKASARKLTRARILLMTDCEQGDLKWTDDFVSKALSVSTATIQRVRQLFVESGLEVAIEHSPSQRMYQHKLDLEAEALLVTLYYIDPPNGRAQWTSELLAERLKEMGYVTQISHETVRKVLKKNGLSLG